MDMNDNPGFIVAYLLDRRGGGRNISWRQALAWTPADGLLWLHLDYTAPQTRAWIAESAGLNAIVSGALLAEETRPRCVAEGDTLLISMRGVNLNPGADPEDMVSIRIWLEENRIITLRHRRILAVDDMRKALDEGRGPRTAGQHVVFLAECLATRIATVIHNIDEVVDDLEDAVLTEQSQSLRGKLAALRRQTIAIRRYLAPQRELLSRLQTERTPLFDDMDRARLRESADRTTRYIEDLDSARERAAVTQEELSSRLSEQMNSKMYLLSIVAAVFLPLGFLTGLLGINVGGIPGGDNPWGFFLVCAILAVLVGLQLWLFRRKHWF